MPNTTMRVVNNNLGVDGPIKVNFKVMVYSIPKSGTHLLSDILALMYDRECDIYSKEAMYRVISHQTSDANLSRVSSIGISTHPNYVRYPVAHRIDARKIFTIRHPLDVAISQYYYKEERLPVNKRRTLYRYTCDMLPGIVRQVERHIEECKRDSNAMLVSFEELTLDKLNTLVRLARFLKRPLTPDHASAIVHKTSFQQVNQQERQNGLYKVGRVQPNFFHRSGKTCQWLQEFQPEQYLPLLDQIPSKLDSYFQNIRIKPHFGYCKYVDKR